MFHFKGVDNFLQMRGLRVGCTKRTKKCVPCPLPVPHFLLQIIIAMPEVHPEMRSLRLNVHACLLTLLIVLTVSCLLLNISLTHFLPLFWNQALPLQPNSMLTSVMILYTLKNHLLLSFHFLHFPLPLYKWAKAPSLLMSSCKLVFNYTRTSYLPTIK